MLVVGKREDAALRKDKSKHGVTPAMRDARTRVFAQPATISRDAMRKVEEQLLIICKVSWILHCIRSLRSQTWGEQVMLSL